MTTASPTGTTRERVLYELGRHGGYIRDRDIRLAAVDPHILGQLVADGTLERVVRGLYRRADAHSAYVGLADVNAAAPHAVICLLSALEYYGLTTTIPPEVYVSIPRKARPPRLDYPPLNVIRYNERMYHYGITEQALPDGRATVRMYSREKSIADALHFSNRIGRDIVVEVLREYLRRPHRDVDELLRAADICRVYQRMTTYLEAIL